MQIKIEDSDGNNLTVGSCNLRNGWWGFHSW